MKHWRIPCEHCGARRACRHYPTAPDGFMARVALAADCLMTGDGIGSRGFDACFEAGDGSYVVAALELKARDNPFLRAGIGRVWDNEPSRERWQTTVQSLRHLRTMQHISDAAARCRNSAARDAQWQGQGELAL